MRILAVFFVVIGVISVVSGSLNINITAHLAKLGRQVDLPKYIKESFQQYLLDVEIQYYYVMDNHHNITTEAKNIIGTAGMDTQTTGPVVVVGTAYNIDGQEDPYNNNGGEVAVMLEVARLFMSSTNGKPRFPIIFVAFDLGSEKCWTEEGRAPGGWTFVQDWLLPHLLYKSYTFEGAIILGPIMNINGEGNGTNILQFQKTFSTLNGQVPVQFKRNFLTLFSHPTNTRFSEGFRKFPSWLEPVPMTENINTSILCQLPIREAQHFWGATRSSNPYPLSAVVITDLGGQPGNRKITKDALDVAERTVKSINDLLLSYHADAFEDGMNLLLLLLSIVNISLLMVVVALILTDTLKSINLTGIV